MAVTFYKLWDYMRRHNIKRKELEEVLSSSTLKKLKDNDIVTTQTLDKICKCLDCELDDICEYEKDNE
jgi:DNA-binding Xre family transcriptional regulator